MVVSLFATSQVDHDMQTEVLVVGGGTGGVAAALTAARCGAKTLLVSEEPWLGGMLTSAGVPAPDGNELLAWQTGVWGRFLRAIAQRQPHGLDHAWVSFFTFEPKVAAAIFHDWVTASPNLTWMAGHTPHAVLRRGDRITGVEFSTFTVYAELTIDATELGDLLPLGEIPHRWGWEWQPETGEPSAPSAPNALTTTYPVQAPTWVVMLRDYGSGETAPEIPPSPLWDDHKFEGAWQGYNPEHFLNYGRLPGDRFMLNWPQQGNDYGVNLGRLVQSATAKQEFLQEARWHSQDFACYVQRYLGRRYGLAEDTFPILPNQLGGGAYALHPYYRESRRLIGLTTVQEQDILPVAGGIVAAAPSTAAGRYTGVAIGNYANDHHYPGHNFALATKSIRWGGRWTGTPFMIPYTCLIPKDIDGFLVAEKNISVTHIANGATRLQPVVMAIGQAAGWLAATAVQQHRQPRDLVDSLDLIPLITEHRQAIFPFFNLHPDHPEWEDWQCHTLRTFEATRPLSGYAPLQTPAPDPSPEGLVSVCGEFQKLGDQQYQLLEGDRQWPLVTLRSTINDRLHECVSGQQVHIMGVVNPYAPWIRVEILDI